jgi:hypothetical protein
MLQGYLALHGSQWFIALPLRMGSGHRSLHESHSELQSEVTGVGLGFAGEISGTSLVGWVGCLAVPLIVPVHLPLVYLGS